MKHTSQLPTLPDQHQNWIAAAQGTITVATLIEGVTTAAYVTIVAGQGNFAHLTERPLWSLAIAIAAFSTMGLYLFVVAVGMGTVFTTDQEQRHQRVKLAASSFYFQVFLVIVFTTLITVATFTNAPDNPRDVTETTQSSSQLETGMPTEKVEPSGNKGVTREHQPQASPSAEPQLSSDHR